jgi:methyltransferase (TIGR00027 family)
LTLKPVIFADTLAEAMLGERACELIGWADGTHPVLAGARAQVTCRSRYTEEALARGVGRGMDQYVLLGAGLDSFAYRSPLADQVRVFEVDHPAMQDDKRRVVGAAPDGVRFVPVDLSRGSLADALDRAGFDPARYRARVDWVRRYRACGRGWRGGRSTACARLGPVPPVTGRDRTCRPGRTCCRRSGTSWC